MKKPLGLTFLACFIAMFSSAQLMVKSSDKGLYLDHIVAAKEGLYSVGRMYNVSPKHIASFNGFDLNKGLNLGESIRIPLSDTNFNQKTAKGFPVYYVPQPGEGLMKVSNNNRKVTLQNLRTWNKLSADHVKAGEKLVVGYLVSKDFKAEALVKADVPATPEMPANKELPKTDLAKQETPKPEPVTPDPAPQQQLKKEVAKEETKKEEMVKEQPAVSSAVPVKDTVVAVKAITPPVTETKTVAESAKPVPESIKPVPESTKPVPESIKPVPESSKPVPESTKLSSENGFFKASFDQQTRTTPITTNQAMTSGIFKTTSGWQDSKYYLLIDGVPTGTIVRIINPDNNRAIYAKVLGEMNGIRQNQGLGIRMSNAAASSLGITDQEKFIVRVNY